MIVHHKMLWPEGTDSWAFNYPGKQARAAAGLGRRSGGRISVRRYGRLSGQIRMVAANGPYRQAFEIEGRTEGYG